MKSGVSEATDYPHLVAFNLTFCKFGWWGFPVSCWKSRVRKIGGPEKMSGNTPRRAPNETWASLSEGGILAARRGTRDTPGLSLS